MKLKLPNLLMTLFLLVFATQAKGQLQEVVASTGGDFNGSAVSVSYTLGEVGIITLTKGSKIITQGFHQPKLVVTAIEELKDLEINIQAYPNPVSEYLHLVSSEILPAGSSYRLFNMNGALVEEKPLEGTNTDIKFQSLVSATYVLKVIQNSKTIKSFKIVKQ